MLPYSPHCCSTVQVSVHRGCMDDFSHIFYVKVVTDPDSDSGSGHHSKRPSYPAVTCWCLSRPCYRKIGVSGRRLLLLRPLVSDSHLLVLFLVRSTRLRIWEMISGVVSVFRTSLVRQRIPVRFQRADPEPTSCSHELFSTSVFKVHNTPGFRID